MRQISLVFILFVAGALSSCLPKVASDPANTQFISDTTLISKYLSQNSIAATKLSAGIWFIIDSAARGIRPTFNDSIKVVFSLKSMADNSVQDYSNVPKHFVLDSLITGIQMALPEFQAGSKGRIFIPTYYSTGYGNNKAGNLIYQFKLTEVRDYQLKLDTTAIDAYLSTNSINAVKDISGLRYAFNVLKTGTKPMLTDVITVSYSAMILPDGTQVSSGNILPSNLTGFIMGWQIGLPNVPEGSTVTLYVPSSLAFGPQGSPPEIGPNKNLIFTVLLEKVTH